MKESSVYEYVINLEDKNSTVFKQLDFIGFDKKVLEFGCSTGYVSKLLKDRGCAVTGIEIDEEAAKTAEAYCERVIVGDIETIDYNKQLSNEKFDVALFGDILEHLKDPKTILLKVKNFLKEKGYIVASIPNVAHWSTRLDLLCGKFDYQELGILDDTHLRFFTKRTITNLLESCGYYESSMDLVRQDVDWVKVSTVMRLKGLNDADIKNFSNILNDSEAVVFQYVIKAVPSAESEYLKKISAEKISLESRILKLEEQITNSYGQLKEKEQQTNELNAAVHGKDAQIKDLDGQITDFFGQLTEKDVLINELNVAISAKAEGIRQLEEEVDARDKQIREFNVAISAKAEGIRQLKEEVDARDKQIREFNVAISAKAEGIRQLKEEVDERDKQISEFNVAISAKAEGIRQLKEEVDERDRQISELNVAISAKAEGIRQLEEEVDDRDKQISELNVAISAKAEGIRQLEEEVDDRDKQISELNVAISAKAEGIRQLEEEVDDRDKQISELNVAIYYKAEGIRRLEKEINTMSQLKSVRLHRKIEAIFKKVRLRRQKEN